MIKVVEFIFFATRLKELRTANGFTQESFAKKLGISKQAYRKYEQGQGFPRPEILKDICLLLNTSEDYLNNTEILPVYQKLNNARQENTIAYAKKQLEEQEKENNILPLHFALIPYKVEEEQALSAGNGEGYTSSQTKETVYWDQDIAYDKAVWIKGDSMEPDFHYGEVALIKYQNYLDFPGQICAVDDVERGQAYIKSVRIEDKYLVLHSLNDSIDGDGNLIFPDKYIPLSENPRIIGKVVDHFTPIEK